MSGPLFITPDEAALERYYAEVKSGDWVCPNGCLGGYMGPEGPGCTICRWGWNADASRLSHSPVGVPCQWDDLPPLAEPHCGWQQATEADAGLLHDHHEHER